MVQQAQVIVHARVASHNMAGVSDADNFPESWGTVVLNVVRVIKGDFRDNELHVVGGISEEDDFNRGPVPYTGIRIGGQGPCKAYNYRVGAEYLLLLRKNNHDALDPYWTSLEPTNEQVRGASDPWIVWVENEVKRRR